ERPAETTTAPFRCRCPEGRRGPPLPSLSQERAAQECLRSLCDTRHSRFGNRGRNTRGARLAHLEPADPGDLARRGVGRYHPYPTSGDTCPRAFIFQRLLNDSCPYRITKADAAAAAFPLRPQALA